MKLTNKQIEKLKKVDIVKVTREARLESSRILNGQCDSIVTYDKYFQKTKHIISACDPEEVIQKFGRLG